MGKSIGSISIDQSHSVIQTLANNVDWRVMDSDILQKIINNPREAGKQFTRFLKNGGRLFVGETDKVYINRSKKFDTESFFGLGCKIYDGSFLVPRKIDLNEIILETFLEKHEDEIKGSDKIERLNKSKCVQLDIYVFDFLWNNKSKIPENWKMKTDGKTTFIFFDGTIFLDSDGKQFVVCLYWHNSEWQFTTRMLYHPFDTCTPSAVLLEAA